MDPSAPHASTGFHRGLHEPEGVRTGQWHPCLAPVRTPLPIEVFLNAQSWGKWHSAFLMGQTLQSVERKSPNFGSALRKALDRFGAGPPSTPRASSGRNTAQSKPIWAMVSHPSECLPQKSWSCEWGNAASTNKLKGIQQEPITKGLHLRQGKQGQVHGEPNLGPGQWFSQPAPPSPPNPHPLFSGLQYRIPQPLPAQPQVGGKKPNWHGRGLLAIPDPFSVFGGTPSAKEGSCRPNFLGPRP